MNQFLTEEKTMPFGNGEQKIYKFPNGFGASVIRGEHTYGGSVELWELAVLEGEDLCYTTPITDDVLGYLEWSEVEKLLDKIKNL